MAWVHKLAWGPDGLHRELHVHIRAARKLLESLRSESAACMITRARSAQDHSWKGHQAGRHECWCIEQHASQLQRPYRA